MQTKGLLNRYRVMALRQRSYPWIDHADLYPIINNLADSDYIPGILTILDLMSGSGQAGNAIKKYMIDKYKSRTTRMSLALVDFCQEMLDLASPKPDKAICQNVLDLNPSEFSDDGFKIVILKLGLQDILKKCHPLLLQAIHNLIDERGQLILVVHYTLAHNKKAINMILKAADDERDISGRYIADLGEIFGWLFSAGLQPQAAHFFSSTVEYSSEEISSTRREESWNDLLNSIPYCILKELGSASDHPWRYKIPGVIIKARPMKKHQ